MLGVVVVRYHPGDSWKRPGSDRGEKPAERLHIAHLAVSLDCGEPGEGVPDTWGLSVLLWKRAGDLVVGAIWFAPRADVVGPANPVLVKEIGQIGPCPNGRLESTLVQLGQRRSNVVVVTAERETKTRCRPLRNEEQVLRLAPREVG